MAKARKFTSVAKSNGFTLELTQPHAAQSLVYYDEKRFQVLIAGRRFGKSLLGTLLCAKYFFSKPGSKVAWFSPTHKMYTHIFRDMMEKYSEIIHYSNIQEKLIILKNNSSIQFWSAESVDSIRGRSYDLAILDEAAYYRNGEIWQAAIRPTLADRKGRAYFFTTPNGRNWLYELYLQGQNPEDPEFKSWQFPSIVSPYFDIEEYKNASHSMPERMFRQEYDAEFLLNSGEVFKNVDIICSMPYRTPYAGRFAFGIDFARSNDFTVIVVYDLDTHTMVDLVQINQIKYVEIVEVIKQLNDLWKPETIIAESNSAGAPLIEMMEAAGISGITPFVTSNTSKSEIIQALALAFERFKISCINDPELQRQLQAFTVSLTATGKAKYSGNAGYHDDMVMALALAYHAQYGTSFFYSKLPKF